ncbi:MAG TPA: hypothetical protein VL334_14970 [Anaerolineae bacterium]|nr:hypothetical protein [Anaerolineae bacterium]
MIDNIHWLGHDSFRLDGDVTIYIDPWKLPAGRSDSDHPQPFGPLLARRHRADSGQRD